MACKLALLSFEIEEYKGLKYDPSHDHNFSESDPAPNEQIQPLIEKVFSKIKRCVAISVNSNFYFGCTKLQNVNNFIHLATTTVHAELLDAQESISSQTSSFLLVKFYKLAPTNIYKVTVDLEEMPSTIMNTNDTRLVTHGLTNRHIMHLAAQLNAKFQLDGRIEFAPVIKRGLFDVPRYLYSTDQRILEHDFDEVLYHEQSEYQDIKIVHSISMGNMLLLDNQASMSECDIQFTWSMLDRDTQNYEGKRVLILGGGDGSLLHDLLTMNPKFVTMIEIDPMVMKACKLHMGQIGKFLGILRGKNYRILIDDCKHALKEFKKKNIQFDRIINDLTRVPKAKRGDSHCAFEPNATQKSNYWYFIEPIFNLSIELLSPGGVYLTRVSGKSDTKAIEAFEEFLMNSQFNLKFEAHDSYIPTQLESLVFYTVRREDDSPKVEI